MPVPGTSQRAIVPGDVLGGQLFAWGDSSNGKLGDGQTATDFSSPIQIGANVWSKISVGGSGLGGLQEGHTLAIRSDGLMFAWGANGSGQIGDNSTTFRSSPVQIGTGFRWREVAAGGAHSVAIREDGLMFTWGQNNVGQLGINSTGNSSSPNQIASNQWIQVSAGADISQALRSDNLMFTWGLNSVGQLGLNDLTNRSSVTQVGASSWTAIGIAACNASHMGAIRLDGILFMWGLNSLGHVGDNTAVNKSSPVQIGASSWKMVTGGNAGTMAIRVDGLLFTWGGSATGELGNSSTVTVSSPIQIGRASCRERV